jgi:shikimate kinase
MNIILTGLRGTGKTSLGRLLARRLRRPFFDTDRLIEERVGEPVQQYVMRKGWDAFRQVEHQVICQVAQRRDAVISTGGGALIYERNTAVLKPTGVIVLLAAEPALLARRLERSYARPPLTAETTLEAEIQALWAEREPLYRRVCDVVFRVDAETADADTDLRRKVAALLAVLRPYLPTAGGDERCQPPS